MSLPGRFDGFWEFNLNPWDTAAGVLIVEEAGGRRSRIFPAGHFRLTAARRWLRTDLCMMSCWGNSRQIFAGRGLEDLPSPVGYGKERML